MKFSTLLYDLIQWLHSDLRRKRSEGNIQIFILTISSHEQLSIVKEKLKIHSKGRKDDEASPRNLGEKQKSLKGWAQLARWEGIVQSKFVLT